MADGRDVDDRDRERGGAISCAIIGCSSAQILLRLQKIATRHRAPYRERPRGADMWAQRDPPGGLLRLLYGIERDR